MRTTKSLPNDFCFVFLFFISCEPIKDVNNLRMAARHVATAKEIADRVLSSGHSLLSGPRLPSKQQPSPSVNCPHLSTHLTLIHWENSVWPVEANLCENLTDIAGWKEFHILWKPQFSWKSWFHSNHCKSNCSKTEIFSESSFERSVFFINVYNIQGCTESGVSL